MDKETRLDYLVGVFGFFQLSMIDIELLDSKGRPPKKRNKLLPTEQDALKIYDWVSEQLYSVEPPELKRRAKRMDEAVKRLNNDHQVVNNYLLALLLLRAYMDDEATKMEASLILPKINRLIDLVDATVSAEEFSPEIRRTTARTADNLFRQYVGKPMLSDEVRDAKHKKWLRRVG
jgi:hypothetical protein